ncbi:MAG: Wzz/FepE/Etk N-terminal domain-containing protein [Clostridia bacterium]|nr:Wzz/FepE/Etk N-terminal domain-containing protein [Clostridia bacterium]
MKELTISYLVQLAWRRWIVLLAALVAFGSIAFCYCRFVATERYYAETSLMVTNGGMLFGTNVSDSTLANGSSNNEFNLSINMMDTYVNYLRTNEIYAELSDTWAKEYPSGKKYRPSELKNMANVRTREDKTFFLDLSISAEDPKDAVRIARLFAVIAEKDIREAFQSTELKPVNVLTERSGARQTDPKTRSIVMLVAFCGMVLTYVIIVLIDIGDNVIAGEEGFTAHYEVPLLGAVPYFESNVAFKSHNSKGGYYYEYGEK